MAEDNVTVGCCNIMVTHKVQYCNIMAQQKVTKRTWALTAQHVVTAGC